MYLEKIFYVFIGILIWQIISTIILFNENDEKYLKFVCGIPYLLYYFYNNLYLLYFKKLYNKYGFYEDDKIVFVAIMKRNFAKEFRKEKEFTLFPNYTIKLLKDGKNFKCIPDKSEILTRKKFYKGYLTFNAEYLDKFTKY